MSTKSAEAPFQEGMPQPRRAESILEYSSNMQGNNKTAYSGNNLSNVKGNFYNELFLHRVSTLKSSLAALRDRTKTVAVLWLFQVTQGFNSLQLKERLTPGAFGNLSKGVPTLRGMMGQAVSPVPNLLQLMMMARLGLIGKFLKIRFELFIGKVIGIVGVNNGFQFCVFRALAPMGNQQVNA